MKIAEVVTVSDARAQLSRILTELADAGVSAEPVLIGAHRKPQGVLLSVEAFEALSGRVARQAAVDSATGSVAAERLRTSAKADEDSDAYARGEISAEELVERAIDRYRPAARREAG
jgi:PHD/YefM family antitoxin component YafN of YafNO toxin-antitoxin module